MSDTPLAKALELNRIAMECDDPPPNCGDWADLYAQALDALRGSESELAAVTAERDALKAENDEHGEAIAAGDGTLHGAIDYWQEQAFAMTAERDKLKAHAEAMYEDVRLAYHDLSEAAESYRADFPKANKEPRT